MMEAERLLHRISRAANSVCFRSQTEPFELNIILGNCVTAARQTLTLFVGVRIPIPQPKERTDPCGRFFLLIAKLSLGAQFLAFGKKWVRTPRPKIEKLAFQAKVVGIFATGEYPISVAKKTGSDNKSLISSIFCRYSFRFLIFRPNFEKRFSESNNPMYFAAAI